MSKRSNKLWSCSETNREIASFDVSTGDWWNIGLYGSGRNFADAKRKDKQMHVYKKKELDAV